MAVRTAYAGQRKEKRAAAAAAGKPTRGPVEAACATVTVYDERAPLHTVRGRIIEEGNHQAL